MPAGALNLDHSVRIVWLLSCRVYWLVFITGLADGKGGVLKLGLEHTRVTVGELILPGRQPDRYTICNLSRDQGTMLTP